MNYRLIYELLFRSKSVFGFLKKYGCGAKILDVGCGNNSASRYKKCFPSLTYTGVDIQSYNDSDTPDVDYYVAASSETFADDIEAIKETFDLVLSRHNLEHCENRELVLEVMCNKLKPGGKLFLSFPSENSITMPSRSTTLNYFDDATHVALPPNYAQVLRTLEKNGLRIIFSQRQYRPKLLFLIGLIQEPVSYIRRKVLQGTWALYGFETIIWAEKREYNNV